MGLPLTEKIFFLLTIITISSGAYKNKWQVFVQIDPSLDYANRPVCNDNLVDLVCYTDARVIRRDCLWECTNGAIKNRSLGEIMHEDIAGSSFSAPAWFCTVKAPALCNCTCTGSLIKSKIGEMSVPVLAHGLPVIEIHNPENYRAPLKGANLLINTTVTSDLPFARYGCPRWINTPKIWNRKLFDCTHTHSTKSAFLELEIHNFSYANAGNYTVTAGNSCGNSFKSILIGIEDDLAPPPDPPSHGKQPLSREEIIVISCVGFVVVIILVAAVVIFRRKNHVEGVRMRLFPGESHKRYGAMQRTTRKYRRILHSIAPEFASSVNTESLLPYLQRHDLVTNSEAVHFIYQTHSLSPMDKNQLLLSCLDEKGMDHQRLISLLCSLNSEQEHSGHKEVAQKLQQLMMDNDIEYENCSICNTVIN